MTVRRPIAALVALPLVLALALGACGDDDDDTATDSTESSDEGSSSAGDETTTTAAPSEDEAGGDEAGGDETGGDEAAGEAVATVFDSSVPFEDKVAMIEGGESHRADHEAYVAAADRVGGITVEPTGVAPSGDAATVTYRVLFAGTEAYADLSMDVTRVDGSWVVPTAEFCGFLASARTPCAAGG
jgi:iron complex transport system substrate-binding protein